MLSEPAAGVSGGVRDKALWTLAVDAYAVEDTERVDRLAQRLSRSSEPGSVLLRNFVRAVREATRGRYTSALELTMPILDSQACAAPLRSRASAPLGLCDPFGRSALHLLRAEWYARLGDTEKAEREWRWYTAVDVVGFPQGLPQGGEVDWALGTYARYRRGLAALARGEADAGCRHLARAAEIWSNAEPAYAEFARRAEQRAEEAC